MFRILLSLFERVWSWPEFNRRSFEIELANGLISSSGRAKLSFPRLSSTHKLARIQLSQHHIPVGVDQPLRELLTLNPQDGHREGKLFRLGCSSAGSFLLFRGG